VNCHSVEEREWNLGKAAENRIVIAGILLVLAAVTAVVFAPLRNQDFVSYDDQGYVYENRMTRAGLNGETLRWALTEPVMGNYHPVTMIALLADISLFGPQPGAMKSVNLALHIASALLLFHVLWRMTGALWAAAAVALLFAAHPLHAEPVAWISSRKDMLSTFFFFLMLPAWLRYLRRNTPPACRAVWYLVSCLCLTLALLSKPMLVTAPFLLLLLDWWPLRRLGRGESLFDQKTVLVRIAEKLPLFALAAGGALSTLYAQQHDKAVAPLDMFPIEVRLGNAVTTCAAYLYRMIFPLHLSVHYPHPGAGLAGWRIAVSAAVLIAITAAAAWRWRRHPWLLTGWAWYLGTLVPVIGIVQVGTQASADRYTYIPLIGIFIMIAWEVKALTARFPKLRIPVVAASLIVLGIMAALCRVQAGYWRDSETLFRHALAVTDENARMHNSLAAVLMQKGENEEAAEHLREAARIDPDYTNARTNLANILLEKGQVDEALALYRESVRQDPGHVKSHYNLGNARYQKGDYAAALASWKQALALDPDFVHAWNNCGLALGRLERYSEAITCYERALELDPGNARATAKIGVMRKRLAEAPPEMETAPPEMDLFARATTALKSGRHAEAETLYRQVLAQDPARKGLMGNLGNALLQQGKAGEAVRFYERGLENEPDNADLHNNLAVALYHMGAYEEAAAHYRDALRIRPDYADAHNNLGSLYHAQGRYREAAAEYREALRLAPDHPNARKNLIRSRAELEKAGREEGKERNAS
jgi:protein O-mannosyl-transferase